jgi:hypothetical protein
MNLPKLLLAAPLLLPCAARACDYPEEGNMPLHRAVTLVKFLGETEAWAAAVRKSGGVAQYALDLDATVSAAGGCYWTLDAVAAGRRWQRFYVSPDGKRLLVEGAGGAPVTLEAWRRRASR